MQEFARLRQEKQEGGGQAVVPQQDPVSGTYQIFDLETLKTSKASALGIDPQQKERHLSDEEFQKAFDMSKEDFFLLKLWRQQKLK